MTRGYFGVAVYRPRTPDNVGTLWRSATGYGAAFLATIGRRYTRQSSDTCRSPVHSPLHHYSDVEDLVAHLPWSCPLVGIELTDDAVPLDTYAHPLRALYLLGAEDNGLPPTVLTRCHQVVQIPTVTPWSLNVAVAGSIVLYDRHIKSAAQLSHPHRQPAQCRTGGGGGSGGFENTGSSSVPTTTWPPRS